MEHREENEETRLIGELVECGKHSFDVAVRESGSEHATLVKMIFACFRKESACLNRRDSSELTFCKDQSLPEMSQQIPSKLCRFLVAGVRIVREKISHRRRARKEK